MKALAYKRVKNIFTQYCNSQDLNFLSIIDGKTHPYNSVAISNNVICRRTVKEHAIKARQRYALRTTILNVGML